MKFKFCQNSEGGSKKLHNGYDNYSISFEVLKIELRDIIKYTFKNIINLDCENKSLIDIFFLNEGLVFYLSASNMKIF